MMTQEDCQLICKLRCRVTKVKTNLKGLFDTHECGACGREEESQKHIIKCTKLSMNTEEYEASQFSPAPHHCNSPAERCLGACSGFG